LTVKIDIPVQRPYLGKEEVEAVAGVFDSRWLGMGQVTAEFEERLREFLGAAHVMAVNTGTSALHIALEVLDLQEGDEVILPSLTFVSAVQAVTAAGARPVFCEVKMETLNLDISDVERRITDKTKVIMPVHFAGLVCQMDEIMQMAAGRGIRVIDDAAHAFGSTYRQRPVGTLADMTCFSFDPIKNITCGEGGAVTTGEEEMASRIALKRNVGIDKDSWARAGRQWFYRVVTPGYRYHMSNINAAIGLAQLERFEAFKSRKQDIVRRYDEAFGTLDELGVVQRDLEETFPFFYIVRLPGGRREELINHLRERGIGSQVHYIPNHLQPLYREFSEPLPVTERLYGEILTLPLYYEMDDGDVERVVDGVASFFRNSSIGPPPGGPGKD
jgi:perosamine synthetase